MGKTLRERLAAGRVIVSDGAMGTMLQAAGLAPGETPDLLNLRQPERVLAVHLGYIAAGADFVTTNTFGGNRRKLARAGLDQLRREINRAAVELAREASGGQVLVAGNVGPTGELLEPYGALTEAVAVAAFAEQAEVLAAAGVDFFLVQTMADLAEARAAVAGIRRVSDLPILCTLSFDIGGRTMMGVAPAQAATALAELDLAGFGANCGQGPEEMELVLREMLRATPQAVLVAQPNAGLPSLQDGVTVYGADPESMAEYARRYAALGVRIIGSCCGSTPAHIEAICQALADYR